MSLQHERPSSRSPYNTSHDYTSIYEACKDKKTTDFFHLLNFPHSARAASDSSTVTASQSSEVRTGCHCNHFLQKHTSRCWLPRWEASRDVRTLNIGRREWESDSIGLNHDPPPSPPGKQACRLALFHWARCCRMLTV